VFARDEFEALSPDETIDRLKSCFDPWWAFGQLSERQISILRSVIHPQIVISPLAEATKAEQPLTVLTYVKSGMRIRSATAIVLCTGSLDPERQ
jgi:hypothetical protein